jgi:hypothetical protein
MATRKRTVYADEFRAQVIRLVQKQGLSRAQVVRDLGLGEDTLARSRGSAASWRSCVWSAISSVKPWASSRRCPNDSPVSMCRRFREPVPGYDSVLGAGGGTEWLVSLETRHAERTGTTRSGADATNAHRVHAPPHIWQPARPGYVAAGWRGRGTQAGRG